MLKIVFQAKKKGSHDEVIVERNEKKYRVKEKRQQQK